MGRGIDLFIMEGQCVMLFPAPGMPYSFNGQMPHIFGALPTWPHVSWMMPPMAFGAMNGAPPKGEQDFGAQTGHVDSQFLTQEQQDFVAQIGHVDGQSGFVQEQGFADQPCYVTGQFAMQEQQDDWENPQSDLSESGEVDQAPMPGQGQGQGQGRNRRRGGRRRKRGGAAPKDQVAPNSAPAPTVRPFAPGLLGRVPIFARPGLATKDGGNSKEACYIQADENAQNFRLLHAARPLVTIAPAARVRKKMTAQAEDEAELPEFIKGLASPLVLAEDQESSNNVCQALNSGGSAVCLSIIRWLVQPMPEEHGSAVCKLSLSQWGCRVVQAALQMAGGRDGSRDMLVNELKPFVVNLYESQHGNHVLSKVVQIMPASSLEFLISALKKKGTLEVAKHRFGCRIMERLIEHCDMLLDKSDQNQTAKDPTGMSGMISEIVQNSRDLSRHKFGNFVVQHLAEFGSPDVRSAIANRLVEGVSDLAMHRSASHVVQRALEHSEQDIIVKILEQLTTSAKPSLVQVACNRYGSFVVEQIARDLEGHCAELYKHHKEAGSPFYQFQGLTDLVRAGFNLHSELQRGEVALSQSECGKRVLPVFKQIEGLKHVLR